MSKRKRRKQAPGEPIRATVTGITHDGRGVSRIGEKTVFIEGALPGEEVTFIPLEQHKSYDLGVVQEVHVASPERVEPRCAHFGVCGGCVLQHMAPEHQITAKQRVLLENFARIGKVTPEDILPPLTGPHWGYRRKARLGVRFVIKKEKLLIGFRERHKPYLADVSRCEVLHPSVGEHIEELALLVHSLKAYDRIAQIEVAVDDSQTALVFRNLDPLDESDKEKLIAFAKANDMRFFLQPGGPDTVAPLWPEQIDLVYRLDKYNVDFHFRPTDFTQVNAEINRKMVDRALEMMELKPDERVLDLFCGLGNFTLPLARTVREVVGVEGSPELVKRAQENAIHNGLSNVHFHAADLAGELEKAPWWQGGFDKVLLDPPRTGAMETLSHIAALGVGRIVYVSCDPATLARDAGILVNQYGYRLEKAGVMDMFPHTAHVESIALFTRRRR